MFSTALESALKSVTICFGQNSMTLSNVSFPLPIIHHAVMPSEHATALLALINEVTLINVPICPDVPALPMPPVFIPLPFVAIATSCPTPIIVNALSMLHPFEPFPLVHLLQHSSWVDGEFTMARLLIIHEMPVVQITVHVTKDAVAILLVVRPFAPVDMPESVCEFPLAAHFVLHELPPVFISVGPDKDTLAVLFIVLKLSSVPAAASKLQFSFAMNVVVLPHSTVPESIWLLELGVEVVLVLPHSTVPRTVTPEVDPIAVLFVRFPFPVVNGSGV